jgi:hypothetical protein
MSKFLVLFMAAQCATQLDADAELSKAQTALESYYSRMQSLQLAYTEQYIPSPDGKPSEDPLASKNSTSRHDPSLVNDHDLLYSFPSARMKVVGRRRTASGDITERSRETRFHRGRLFVIDATHKQFNVKTSNDPNPFPYLPIDALGLRVLHTLTTPLSDFLIFPDITELEGVKEIDGERVYVFKVGPNIPLSVRSPGWSDETVLRLSLAPDRNYLPVRTEIVRWNKSSLDEEIRLSVGTFGSVQDVARGTEVLFPHKLEVAWPNGGVTKCSVQSVIVNPPVSERDFTATAPAGYAVSMNGIPETLSGGEKERETRINQSVDEAKRLLATVDPPRASAIVWFSWPIAVALSAAMILVLAFFMKGRLV